MAAVLPGGLPEIVFSFDTTGSMSSCLTEVRDRLQDLIQRLQGDIPGIRIAVFAHGDYCDKHNYVTKWIDFSTDVKKLCSFVKKVKSTGGGDADECYELVLRQVGEELSWTPDSNRVLVMIGDASPHEPDYPDNKLKINWRKEVDTLRKMGVKIYGVECHGASLPFYTHISSKTGGQRLPLDSFSNLFDFMMAICYREHGADMLDVYEKEVRARGGGAALSDDMEGMFTTLRKGVASASTTTTPTAVTGAVSKVGGGAGKKARAAMARKTRASKTVKFEIETKKVKPTGVRSSRLKSIKKTNEIVKKVKKIPTPLLREEIEESRFTLNEMNWSPWVKAMALKLPANQSAESWEKREDAGKGFRVKQLFKFQNGRPAFYEVAVQTQKYCRKFVIFSKFCHHITSGECWESRLFGSGEFRSQVNKVLNQGCNVYVRRLVYRSTKTHYKKTVPFIRSYDYAWRTRKSRDHARLVNKQSKLISSDKI